ncbi:uncharacterized protein [Palaemon carinicauda]|uniref:uncharacterized protein n=1 Tax=Palaemon carinicauda TaxID=392227 RepID=UPI0035B598AC
MISRFHHTLKATLISCCKDSNWFTQLTWVLLGLRITSKVSATEMVYGDPLVISAKFFATATSCDNLQRLHHFVGKFTPCCQTYKPPAKQHMLTDLHLATHVFLRNDTSNPPITPPCMGSLLEICCMLKELLINKCGKEDRVSIDRLKPVYLLTDDPPTVCLFRAGRPISHIFHSYEVTMYHRCFIHAHTL